MKSRSIYLDKWENIAADCSVWQMQVCIGIACMEQTRNEDPLRRMLNIMQKLCTLHLMISKCLPVLTIRDVF